jgi:phytoene/squalene synthetase
MCLKVFCKGDETQYEALRYAAMKLGAAFQKINFLRDIKADYEGLGRVYFPNTDFKHFNRHEKQHIELDIAADFSEGLQGIKQLPRESKMGVFLAYVYYQMLFKKIKAVPVEKIMQVRIRVPDIQKIYLMLYTFCLGKMNLIR